MDKTFFKIVTMVFLLVMSMYSVMDCALTEQDCGSVVNNTLMSPGYPNDYPNNLDCNYSVPIPHGMAMRMYFHDFIVEYSPTCEFDYLKITNENSETFGLFCGWRYGKSVIVSGIYAQLTFHSDSAGKQWRGFNISFTIVPLPEIGECVSVVNNTLTSPGYPYNYPSNMNCNYSVPIPHGMAVKINLHEFDVEYERDCEYDYLKISNDVKEIFGVICGKQHGEDIIVVGGSAELTFYSDSDIQERGFLISFSAVAVSGEYIEDNKWGDIKNYLRVFKSISPNLILRFTVAELKECGSVVNNTLKSPGYPGYYPSDMDCNYTVPIPRGMGLKIIFDEFDVEFDSSCYYDYLEITNENSQKFGVFCGERFEDVTVTGSYAQLTFHSDSDVQKGGFVISFTALSNSEIIKCGSVVNNTLTSPGYPDNYPQNMDCNYSVPIPHGMAVKINFDAFDLEYASSCEYDYLKITNENSETFGVLCGELNGTVITVTGNYAQLTFHCDSVVQKRGFVISFTVVPKSELCGSVVNNTLTSPGYPNNYPSNMDCNYYVPIPHSMALKITFHEFDVEYESKCWFDYLIITNNNNKAFGWICGQRSGTDVNVTGEYVLLIFHSDAEMQNTGFLLSFTAVPLPETTPCHSLVNNTLTSPAYPGNYPSNMDCNYTVPIPHGMALKITFQEFEVEDGPSCKYDYLKITNEKGKLFGKHCGGPYMDVNMEVNVTGNYARLIFHSDADLEKRGFLLHLTVVPAPDCGRVINNTLTSPGYPNKYPNNMDCIYSVPIPPGMAMKITFQEFDVEYDPSRPLLCPYDYLTIKNERKDKFAALCGKKSGKEVTVIGDYALLTFSSDVKFSSQGFVIIFTFLGK
ncbi:cubilin-like [Oculina patagonica]